MRKLGRAKLLFLFVAMALITSGGMMLGPLGRHEDNLFTIAGWVIFVGGTVSLALSCYFLLRRKRCYACNTSLPMGDSSFCPKCGRNQKATCVKCGIKIEPGSHYCTYCGKNQEGLID